MDRHGFAKQDRSQQTRLIHQCDKFYLWVIKMSHNGVTMVTPADKIHQCDYFIYGSSKYQTKIGFNAYFAACAGGTN